MEWRCGRPIDSKANTPYVCIAMCFVAIKNRLTLSDFVPLYHANTSWILQVEKISIASQATPFRTEFLHAKHK